MNPSSDIENVNTTFPKHISLSRLENYHTMSARRQERGKAPHHEIFRFDHENVFNPFATMPEKHPFLSMLVNQQNQTGDPHA
jgi:hypothetical protein